MYVEHLIDVTSLIPNSGTVEPVTILIVVEIVRDAVEIVPIVLLRILCLLFTNDHSPR